jgi:uncharacterized protein YodC (DUF2158 family)
MRLEKQSFRVGDLVRHKSGGPIMVVERVGADSMSPSCPRLSRASTSLRSCNAVKTWMAGTGHPARLRAGIPTSPAMTPRTVDGFAAQ